MKPSEFVSRYNLHDSFIESVASNPTDCALTLRIHFAYWMQKDYQHECPETGILIITFHNVRQYQCEDGDPTGRFVGILDAESQADSITINLLDDETGHCFCMLITADDITAACSS